MSTNLPSYYIPNQHLGKNPVFIFSGTIPPDDLKRYEKIIQDLKGQILTLNNDQFVSSCTHIVCFSFFATVKIMGGLASGKWLVGKGFLEESYKAGKWLNEEPFEIKDCDFIAKFHRCRRQKIFNNFLCYVSVKQSCHVRHFKRILIAGGAKIFTKDDIIDDGLKVQLAITDQHCFEETKNVVGESTPILDVEYIKATVLQKHEPGDMKKFLLNPNTVKNINLDVFSKKEKEKSFLNKFSRSRIVDSPGTPTKKIIRRRNTPTVACRNIASYFIKIEDSEKKVKQAKRTKIDYSDSSQEIKFIKVVKPAESVSKEKEHSLIHLSSDEEGIKISSQEDADSDVTCVVSPSRDAVLPEPDSPMENGLNQSREIDHSQQLTSTPMASFDSTTTANSAIVCSLTNGLDSDPEIHSHDQVEEHSQEQDQKKVKLKSEDIRKAIFKKNITKVVKKKNATVYIDDKRLHSIISRYLIQLNSSYFYLNTCHIPVNQYPTDGSKVRELKHNESLYTPTILEENWDIVKRKIGSFVVKEVQKKKQIQESSDNVLVDMPALEWLQIRIQPDVILHPDVLGLMIRRHILESSCKEVSEQALCTLQSIIYLHPPHNKRMRDYYLNVFQATLKDDECVAQYKGWRFVKRIVKDLLSDGSEALYNVHTMMDCILKLSELDLVHYNKKPVSVKSLLSYRFFWVEVSQNPSIMNDAVRELLQFWVLSAEQPSRSERRVTKLVSIMLEIVWKWSNFSNPYLLVHWPIDNLWLAIANEVDFQFKEMNKYKMLLLVQGVKGPWQQMFLTSIALRSLSRADDCKTITLPYLKSTLAHEIKSCGTHKEKEDDSNSLHAIRAQLLALLLTSFVHATGCKFFKDALARQFISSLYEENVLCPHGNTSKPDTSSLSQRNESTLQSLSQRNETTSDTITQLKDKKRKFDDGSVNGNEQDMSEEEMEMSEKEEDNLPIEIMMTNVKKSFQNLAPLIKEMKALSLNCQHVARWRFTNAL